MQSERSSVLISHFSCFDELENGSAILIDPTSFDEGFFGSLQQVEQSRPNCACVL